MADNYITNPGAGGITFAGDEDGGAVQWPLIKLAWGPLDTFNILADAAGKRLPIALNEVNVTVPISAAALPLPAGASTAAKQPALGTAGAAAADVLSVQGIAAMTPLKVDGSAVTQPVSGTVTANLGTVAGLFLDATFTGRINTLGQKTMANSTPVALASDQSALAVSGTVTTNPPANASTNVTQFGGSAVATGTGVGGAGVPRVTVSSDSFPATQAVSGTVTANQGGAPWAENVTQFGGVAISTGTGVGGTGIPRVTVSNDSQTKLWDGITQATVKPASIAAVAADAALVVAMSPNSAMAQESGNLLINGYALRTLVDIQIQVLSELRALNLQMANISGYDVPASTFLDEQTLQ